MSGMFRDLVYDLSHPHEYPMSVLTFAAGVLVVVTFFALIFRIRTDPDRGK